jgi:outer membrane protein
MKNFFFIGAFFFVFIPLGAFAQSHPPLEVPRVLSLQDCIAIALAQNPDLKAASASVDVLQARVAESYSALLPSVGAFYNWTRQLSPIGAPIHASFGTFRAQPLLLNYYRDGFSLSQLIYDGQRTASLFHEAVALKNAQAQIYQQLIQATTFNVTQAYYKLLADRKFVEVAKEDLKNTKEHLREAQASYEAGTAAKADVVFAEVPVATAKLNLTQARETEKQAEAALNRLLSFEVNTNLVLKDELSETPYSITLPEASQTALQNRPEIREYESYVESARNQLNAAKGEYWPTISAFATYGWTSYSPDAFPTSLGYTYGLQATFDLYNGGLRSGKVQEAQALLRQYEASLESTRQNVLLDVKNAYLAYESAKESIEEAKTELKQATVNLQMVEGEYKVGVAPILNLLDAEQSKIQAEQHLINALANYNIAIAQLNLAMGKI